MRLWLYHSLLLTLKSSRFAIAACTTQCIIASTAICTETLTDRDGPGQKSSLEKAVVRIHHTHVAGQAGANARRERAKAGCGRLGGEAVVVCRGQDDDSRFVVVSSPSLAYERAS